MKLPLHVINAFTTEQFRGNPAAVVIVENWLETTLLQTIATENNLPETSFIRKTAPNRYHIRWFTPLQEIAFCGHGTLAAAFVLFAKEVSNEVLEPITFTTDSVGELVVSQNDAGIAMNFPQQIPEKLETVPVVLLEALALPPREVWRNSKAYIAIYDNESDIRNVHYDKSLLLQLAPYGVAITASAQHYDFVSRYFSIANGGKEDPVTGSMHAGLAPLWAQRLGKKTLHAYQASSRGGTLWCQLNGERVIITGNAVRYLQGTINLNDAK